MSQARLTNSRRLEICEHKTKNPTINQNTLAAWASKEFGVKITQSGISLILKKRSELVSLGEADLAAKRPRVAKNPQLEEVLATWILQCQTRRVGLSRELIKVKAKSVAERLGIPKDAVKIFDGWKQRFQERNKLLCIKIHSESGLADQEVIDGACRGWELS